MFMIHNFVMGCLAIHLFLKIVKLFNNYMNYNLRKVIDKGILDFHFTLFQAPTDLTILNEPDITNFKNS